MNTATLLSARPKIHKPPAFLSHKAKSRSSLSGVIIVLAALLLITAGVLLLNKHKMSIAAYPEVDTAIPVSEPMVPDAKLAVGGGKDNNMIVLEGASGGIVGEMAKIPPDGEPISETKITGTHAASDIDKNGAGDLLSIINKY